MSFISSAYNLLFDQRRFFEENTNRGLLVPGVLTILYAIVSVIFSIPALSDAAAQVPGGLGGTVVGISAVSAILYLLLTWVVVSALFFFCLKFIGYAACSFRDVLSVCGYVSGILLVSAVLTGLVSLIGTPAAVLSLLLQGVFLLWSIPVWYFGFAAVCDIPQKKLKLSIAIPIIIMVVNTVVTSAGALLAL